MTDRPTTPDAIARLLVFNTVANIDVHDEWQATYPDAPTLSDETVEAVYARLALFTHAIDTDGTMTDEAYTQLRQALDILPLLADGTAAPDPARSSLGPAGTPLAARIAELERKVDRLWFNTYGPNA